MERFDVDKETLYYLYELFKAGRVKLDPTYQRGRVWSDDLRYTLIESIRNQFPIGLVMFNVWQHADEDGAKTEHFDVVDGQQRIRTIIEYIDAQEGWAQEDNGDKAFVPFQQLTPAQQARFKEYKIPVAKMKEFELEEITECFNRLQYGRPLKIGEKLKSLTTRPNYPFIKALTEHRIFEIDARHRIRDAHWTLATAFLKSTYSRDLFARQEYKNLEQFLKSESDTKKAAKALEASKKVLNYEARVLDEALAQDLSFSRYAQTARTLKWLFVVLATLMKTHGLAGREHKVAEGVLKYYALIAQDGTDEWFAILTRAEPAELIPARFAMLSCSSQIRFYSQLVPSRSIRNGSSHLRSARRYISARGVDVKNVRLD